MQLFLTCKRSLFFISFLSLLSNAQELDILKNDSSLTPKTFVPYISLTQPEIKKSSLFELMPQSISFYLTQSLSQPLPTQLSSINCYDEIDYIWKRDQNEQNKYQTLKTIVGTIQMGGVAYLAYLHLKKYGFR